MKQFAIAILIMLAGCRQSSVTSIETHCDWQPREGVAFVCSAWLGTVAVRITGEPKPTSARLRNTADGTDNVRYELLGADGDYIIRFVYERNYLTHVSERDLSLFVRFCN